MSRWQGSSLGVCNQHQQLPSVGQEKAAARDCTLPCTTYLLLHPHIHSPTTMPAPLTQPGALEESLLSFGVPLAEVTRCVRVAVAWRVTPNGRPLVDRRRYSRLRRNVQIVSDYLQSSCHIAPGEHWGKAWPRVGTVHVTVLHLDINGLRQSKNCTVTMYKDSGLCCALELITDCVLVLPTPPVLPCGSLHQPAFPRRRARGRGRRLLPLPPGHALQAHDRGSLGSARGRAGGLHLHARSLPSAPGARLGLCMLG